MTRDKPNHGISPVTLFLFAFLFGALAAHIAYQASQEPAAIFQGAGYGAAISVAIFAIASLVHGGWKVIQNRNLTN